MKKIFVFGDSWPAGMELSHGEKTFGELLADRMGLQFINLSKGATSLEHLLLQLKNAVETYNDLADNMCLFFLTSRTRSVCFRNDQWVELTVESANRDYINLYSDEIGVFRSNMVLLSLQNICRHFRLEDYYIAGWEKLQVMLPGIDLDRIYDNGQTHCLNFFRVLEDDPTDDTNFIYFDYNHFIRPNVCHPNQLGHITIADKLYDWIISK